MNEQTIIYSALRTPDGTVIESNHRHDYKEYADANGKTYMIDGGLDYIRASANGDEVFLTVYSDGPHDDIREFMKWGTRGKDGKQPLRYVALKDMDTDHIQACLDTQWQMRPEVRVIMQNELKYRSA
jgi:hypothetical protein